MTSTTTFEGLTQRKVLAGMAFDPTVLAKAASLWTREPLFLDRAGQLIGSWCVEFWESYGRPPKRKALVGMAVSWGERHKDAAAVELVERQLQAVFEERAQGKDPPQYLVDLAGEFFTRNKFDRVVEKARALREAGRLREAVDVLSGFSRVEMGANSGSYLLTDEAAVKAAFSGGREESLVRYPGDLGAFFGPSLEREGFVAFMAPEGTGKTFWLVDLAVRAVEQRLAVAFFAVGDMSEQQIDRRFLTRISARPRYAGEVKVPVSFEEGVAAHEVRAYPAMSPDRAWEEARKVQGRLRSKRNFFLREAHPNDSINVDGVRARLREQERKGWVPDVVVVDYADVLADPSGRFDNGRDPINKTWKQLRRLSQELHCLVVTATQARRDGYDARVLRKKHVTDDKRKLAHATAVFGINQDADEKEAGIFRLNPIKTRDMESHENHCVQCLSCLDLGNPAVLSYYPRARRRGKPDAPGA